MREKRKIKKEEINFIFIFTNLIGPTRMLVKPLSKKVKIQDYIIYVWNKNK